MGGQPTSSQANNTSTTNANTTVGSIGLTGQNAVDVLNLFSNVAHHGITQGANTGQYLGGVGANFGQTVAAYGANTGYGIAQLGANAGVAFGAQGVEGQRLGYQFGTDTITQSLAYADRTNARVTDTLVGTINAVRDFNQRSLNAGLGASSPIQSIPGASSSVPVLAGNSEISPTLLVVLAGAALLVMSN